MARPLIHTRHVAIPRIILTPQRTLHTTYKMSDEYSKKAVNEQPTLNEKLNDARAFIKSHKTVLLTTRSPNGQLHARTMAIAEVTADWKFRFIYDGESYKEKEVDNECVFDRILRGAGGVLIKQ